MLILFSAKSRDMCRNLRIYAMAYNAYDPVFL